MAQCYRSARAYFRLYASVPLKVRRLLFFATSCASSWNGASPYPKLGLSRPLDTTIDEFLTNLPPAVRRLYRSSTAVIFERYRPLKASLPVSEGDPPLLFPN